MEIGATIVFDQDGEIIKHFGEMQGDVIPRKPIEKLDFISLKYGEINFDKYRLVGINIETKEPILEEIPVFVTEEEKRIQELENQILLNENEKVGGLL
ncbi:TPA: hypothetical protein ACG3RE_003231 [Clostridioides difficile]|nr:hypothetical protein [Clostridioides difficile]